MLHLPCCLQEEACVTTYLHVCIQQGGRGQASVWFLHCRNINCNCANATTPTSTGWEWFTPLLLCSVFYPSICAAHHQSLLNRHKIRSKLTLAQPQARPNIISLSQGHFSFIPRAGHISNQPYNLGQVIYVFALSQGELRIGWMLRIGMNTQSKCGDTFNAIGLFFEVKFLV